MTDFIISHYDKYVRSFLYTLTFDYFTIKFSDAYATMYQKGDLQANQPVYMVQNNLNLMIACSYSRELV